MYDIFLLDGLSVLERSKVIEILKKPKLYGKGDVIYSHEAYKKAIGIILKGSAYAITNNNSGLYMKSFGEGSVFGVAAVFGENGGYISTVIAESTCEVLFIEEDILKNIFASYPKIAENYIKLLTDKIRFLNSKIDVISSGNVEDTIYRYLCLNRDKNGYVVLPKNMTTLAKTIGISRASLYRCIDDLDKKGKIKKENNSLKVI